MQTHQRTGFLFAILPLAIGCGSTPKEPTLDEVRSIAAKYSDVNVAKAEGYTTDNKCVTAEKLGQPAALGAMGLHYVRAICWVSRQRLRLLAAGAFGAVGLTPISGSRQC